ncbi:MAG: nucleotidyltransferase family protein [Deltaproteobacteria bacterium]|nr:nucleotidyltransferase family protein [Deltaproteobacteria bacterium]
MQHKTSTDNLKAMDVVILIGGKGTRLKDVINDRPKPMAEINGRPFLDILIEYVASFGFCRFILCSGYMSDFISRYYEKQETSYSIIISKEKEPLGTGGAVKNAECYIKSDPFLVMNGDSFCLVNLEDFVGFHIEKKADLSLSLASIDNAADYGTVKINQENCIESFVEKGISSAGYINAGVYIFNKSILEKMPSEKAFSLENDLFPQLAGKSFYGYETGGEIIDIGTPERYRKAQQAIKKMLRS